ncbi:MAG: hypothetical protein IPL46_09695 [Saprospiraceae bacterium]|nr:hypothetical protein [Saprospiraceae bacterium]
MASGTSLAFIFFWLGAIGLYFLLRHLEFERFISVFGSLIFMLAPYNMSLVINGHDTKIQAIMYAPWIFWALLRVLKNQSWLDVCLLTLFAGLQIRTSHYQVVFYTAILSIIFVFSDLIRVARENRKMPWRRLLLLSVAAAGALLIATRPLLLAANYAGDSVRGREVVRMNDQSMTTGAEKGVSKSFVKNWSFEPVELLSLVVARATGGNSNEYYGKARSIGFRQDVIPGYWGHSPYNGSYYYMGTFVFLLVFVAFFWIKRYPLLWQLGAGLVLMLIWSLGTFTGPIYDLSYQFIPFFSNFRTPTTSMSMVYLLAAIIAAYGLRSISFFRNVEIKKLLKLLGIVAGVAVLLFIIGNSISFINPNQKLQPNVVDMLIEARRSMYFDDLFWFVVSILIFAVFVWLYVKNKISLRVSIVGLLVFTAIDLLVVSSRYDDKAISWKEFNRSYLDDSQTTLFLKNDASNFRVLAMGNQNFGLPAHVQTIGGGYDMQMNKSMYELTNNSLYQKLDGNTQINWNVLDFLNVKYVVSDRVLENDRLNQQLADPAKGIYTYRYKFNKERGFFVDGFQIIKDDVAG